MNICFDHSCKPITFMSYTYFRDLLLTFVGKLNVFVVSNISVIDAIAPATRIAISNEICFGKSLYLNIFNQTGITLKVCDLRGEGRGERVLNLAA